MKKILLAIMAIILVVIGYITITIYKQAYSWNEMDWNEDGHTSLNELLDSPDIGKRIIIRNGKKYIEYYSLKDGRIIKIKTIGN